MRSETRRMVIRIHGEIGPLVDARIAELAMVWSRGCDAALFIELVFCLLTPQSSARRAWRAVERLVTSGLLYHGSAAEISEILTIVRFRNNKARYIVEARSRFLGDRRESLRELLAAQPGIVERRHWLVKNIKGMGYKEASHYLRNIGFGADVAILDRHILRNMQLLGIIKEIPSSLPSAVYHDLERRLRSFSAKVGIPLGHLDFVLWYKETGDIFK